MAEWNVGDKNGMWRGGRTITDHGYVLIRVGVGHPDADVRGYAYEHRLVAQQKIGRRLRKGELVHHIDENKQNNHPDNLMVIVGNAHHFVHHRKEGSRNRLPDEDNPSIVCACGCNTQMLKYDEGGRPRIYISGHNGQPSPTQNKIFAMIRSGIKTRQEMLQASDLGKHALSVCISKMKREGKLVSTGHGSYDLPEVQA